MPADQLEVWLDAGIVDVATQVGKLYNDRGQIRFEYEAAWINHPHAFALDPSLGLGRGSYFPRAEDGNFGIFLDSCPDRWGHPLAAPPFTSLRTLEAVALELTAKKIDDLGALRKWLSVLVASGASLGGARPKANYRETDGTLWIAKFPSREDNRDAGAWEWVVHQLAAEAKITVPAAKIRRFKNPFHTFCVQRFDRAAGRRVFYASAMTLLSASQSEGKSYLDIAEFIQKHGADPSRIARDLEQLFRRVVFNVAVGNRDDHLRNHGFVLTKSGWALSKVFDVNPSIDKTDHVLNLDAADNRPSMTSVFDTARYYSLSDARAEKMISEILGVTSQWRKVAKKASLSRADIELTAVAFEGGHLRF